jgi:2-aminoadipate transaminase
LINPGDLVVVEDPTFNSILNMLKARAIPHLGVPMEHDGMDVDYLERLLTREKPRLIITIPTLHNPTGVTTCRAKRDRILELAQQHRVPIIEDQWAMLLGHEGKSEPAYMALDTGGHVIQIGSFSKVFLPGTRVAWVALHRELGLSFVKAKRAMDRSDSYFLQTLVHEFIKKGFLDLHCRKVDRIYRARRELMDELMRQHFRSEISWKKPSGGFSFWVSLPEWLSSTRLLKQAVAQGIEFAPGNYFHVGRRESSNLRLAFSTLTQPQLRQGIRRLGNVMAQALDTEHRQASGER